MVCHSLRHDGEELLAQRDGVEGYVRTGRWMGVPLLHPWANRLDGVGLRGARAPRRPGARSPATSSSATARPGCRSTACCRGRGTSSSRARPRASVAELAPDGAAFPFPHRIRLEAELSPTALRIATTLEALEGEVPVAFGFHPWIALPGVPRGRVRGRAAGDAAARARRAAPADGRDRARRTRSRARCRSASSTTASTRSPTAPSSPSRAAGAGSRCASSPASPARRCSRRPTRT